MNSVVVAARPLVIGTAITAKDLKVVAWPAGSLVPGAITDLKDAVDRGLLTSVLENEPLTTDQAGVDRVRRRPVAGDPDGHARHLGQGQRRHRRRRFIVPGSRVDVVVTIRRPNDSMTRTAASNVQVLTAGTRKDQENPGASESRAGRHG